jgi:cytosine permease
MSNTDRGRHSSVTGVAESEVDQIDHVLGEEYEHKPVPASARRSMFSVTMVWIGFPMIITGAMTGSVLVLGMGFQRALIAMIIGNLVMFAYVGALGALGTKKGMNFALIASIVFGRKGYVFSSGLLSTLLLGWYAVQTGITGNLVSSTYNLNYVLMTVIAGVLYIGITFVGVKGLHYIGLVSVPLFVILGVWVAADSVANHGWSAVMSYAGADGKGAMSMGVGLTIVLTLFVDAGTVTADFNRWAKDLKGSLVSTFSAFPFANLVAMLVGGIMTAALATPNANPFGADNMFGYMNDKQLVWLSVIAFIFLYCNLGSVCSHCLYNAATGWSRILGSHMRLLAVALGVIGIIVAAWTAEELTDAVMVRKAVTNKLWRFMTRYDLLLTPTLAVPPFQLHVQGPEKIDGNIVPPFKWLAFTFPFNLTGQPAATVLAGFSKDGLPIGLQIVGRHLDDPTVMRAAKAFETAHPWHDKWPSLLTSMGL